MIMSFVLANLALIVGFLLALVMFPHMLRQRRSPSSTIAWLLAIALLPYVGVPLYLLIGGRKIRRASRDKPAIRLTNVGMVSPLENSPLCRLLTSYEIPNATAGNHVTFCETGEQAYSTLIKLIDDASRSIYITMFLLREDEVGREIVDRLARRAADGIRVRVLLDGIGSLHTSNRFLSPITEAGGRTAFFIPVIHQPFRGGTNLRNHRKLVIIDEKRVMAGGMNIGAEYMGPTPSASRWRDLSFTLEGPATRYYFEVFCSDWKFATGEHINTPEEGKQAGTAGEDGAVVQIVPSGPDVVDDPLYEAILSAVFAAESRIWVVTPYFVPDEALAHALELAVHRGVDVHILVPEKSNHPLADLAGRTYIRELQKAGCKVLLYTGGMMHAKVMAVDDTLAIIGSANFDMRSLFLDYEIALFLYSKREIEAVGAWVKSLAECSCIGITNPDRIGSVFEGIVKMMTPLL